MNAKTYFGVRFAIIPAKFETVLVAFSAQKMMGRFATNVFKESGESVVWKVVLLNALKDVK